MNVLRNIFIVMGAAIVGTYLAYEHVLSDEQREELRAANHEIQKAFRDVADTIEPIVSKGPTRAEEEAAVEANQERTRKQWNAIGY